MTKFYRVATCKEMIAKAIEIISVFDPMFEKTIIDSSIKSDNGNISFDPKLIIDIAGKGLQIVTLNAMHEETLYTKKTEAFSRCEALRAEVINVASIGDFPVKKETKEEKHNRLIDKHSIPSDIVWTRHPRFESIEEQIKDMKQDIEYNNARIKDYEACYPIITKFVEDGGIVNRWIDNKRVLSHAQLTKQIERYKMTNHYLVMKIKNLEKKVKK